MPGQVEFSQRSMDLGLRQTRDAVGTARGLQATVLIAQFVPVRQAKGQNL